MPLPTVVSCRCDPAAVSAIPELVITPRSRVRVPGELDRGLRGYYPLGSFNGLDASGLGNHATQATTPAGLTNGILCEQAEVMDGRQYYTLPYEMSDIVTVSAWMRPNNKDKLEQTLLSIGANVRFGLSWMLEPIIWLNQNTPSEAVINAAALTTDTWYHVAFVRDGNEFRIYVDGIAVPLFYEGQRSTPVLASVDTESGAATISRYREASGLIGAYQDVVVRAAAMEGHEIAAEYESYCQVLFEAAEL